MVVHADSLLAKLRRYIEHPIIRWTLTLLWTALAARLMVAPSGDGTLVTWLSRLLGGTEQTDAIGHLLISAALAGLWYWTLCLYVTLPQAGGGTLLIGLGWSLLAELSQSIIPTRGTTILDLGANLFGVLLGILGYWLAHIGSQVLLKNGIERS